MVLDTYLLPAARSLDLYPVIKEYLLTCRLDNKSPGTIVTYRNYLTAFADGMAGKPLDTRHVRLFLLSLGDRGVKASTVNLYYRCLSSFFHWCVAERLMKAEESPMQNIRPPKFIKPEIKPYSKQDIDNLLMICHGDSFLEVRNKAIILVALDTGLRLAELASLSTAALDMDTGLVTLLGKGNKRRTVRIGVNARKALMRYMRFRNPAIDNLWQTEERRALKKTGMISIFRRICKRAEITDTRGSAHTFRHSCAMYSLRNGARINDIKELFGHSKIQTTQIYLDAYDSQIAAQEHAKFSPVDNL